MKNASVWAFSALFGCISLFGPGWHYFVGHQFHASSECHGRCDDHVHAAAESEHLHEEASEEGLAAVDVHEHDCPICGFFAQVQWAFVSAPDELELAACGAVAVAMQCCWVEQIGIYQSRAPPSVSPIC